MIGTWKVPAVIAARGGSKGLLGKNLRELGGKPLVARAIAVARASATVDRVIVSTDDLCIAEAALHPERRWLCHSGQGARGGLPAVGSRNLGPCYALEPFRRYRRESESAAAPGLPGRSLRMRRAVRE